MTIPDTNNWIVNKTYEKGIYTGLNWTTFQNNLSSDYKRDYTSNDMLVSFSIVFGVLFSGVTGIMAGANMSGKYNFFLVNISTVLYVTHLGRLSEVTRVKNQTIFEILAFTVFSLVFLIGITILLYLLL